MKFIQTPVKGMQDFLPGDMALRQHVLGVIRETYGRFGFTEIETPVMEHIENLTGKNGGENEKLIFKVEKRGRELEKALGKVRDDGEMSPDAAGTEIADSALRYDLTVPLCRYYACHRNDLPSPFKALQIGNVFRADRPQKGRFRQFTQCDIDIIGDGSIMAEIELIAATSKALTTIFAEVGISAFTIHLNDRRVLKAMAANAGFTEDQYDEIFIILDKMDKIGLDGVKENLLEEGFAAESVEKYVSFFRLLEEGTDMKEFILLTCGTDAAQGMSDDLSSIMEAVSGMLDASVTLKFDPTLVRGMSYYTGTIFEITIDNYSFSIAGGGRYDRMVGRFCGQDAPACGFSIGFERIVTILRDLNWKMPQEAEKAAYLVDMKSAGGRVKEVFEKATRLREAGMIVTVQPLRKNAKFQVDMLESAGYGKIEKVYADTVL
jgi:histidyl-tRNA synthetase